MGIVRSQSALKTFRLKLSNKKYRPLSLITSVSASMTIKNVSLFLSFFLSFYLSFFLSRIPPAHISCFVFLSFVLINTKQRNERERRRDGEREKSDELLEIT